MNASTNAATASDPDTSGSAACPRADRAASCRPAAQPSVRASSAATCAEVQAQAHHLVEEGVGLLRGEPEVGGADLQQLAARAQARQREGRVRAGGEGQGDLRRQLVQQGRHHGLDRRHVDEVVVVQGDDRGPAERVEVVDQAGHDVLDGQVAAGVQQGQRLQPHQRARDLQGGHEVGEEGPRGPRPRVARDSHATAVGPSPVVRLRLGGGGPATGSAGWSCRTRPGPRPARAAASWPVRPGGGPPAGRGRRAVAAGSGRAAWCQAPACVRGRGAQTTQAWKTGSGTTIRSPGRAKMLRTSAGSAPVLPNQ